MAETTPVADDTSRASLTVADAQAKFLNLLTPQGHEEPQEPTPERETPEADPDGAPAPADSPDADPGAGLAEETPAEEPVPEPEHELALPDGKVERVTLDELKKGYLRQSDYTRKRQADAERERQLAVDDADVRSKRQMYAERLTALEDALKDLDGAEPDAATLDTLRRENPAEYAAVRADLQDRRERQAAIRAERERVQAEEAETRRKDAAKHFAEERVKLLNAVPEWKDLAKAEVASREIVSTAQQYGFAEADIHAGMHDHRIVLLLRDAAELKRLKAKVPDTKKKVEALRTATPGAQRSLDRGVGEKKALERLSQTGRTDDAAAVFLERSKQRA